MAMGPARKVVTVVALTFLNLLNGTDRYAVAGLLEQISDFYKIDDSQSGLLQTVYIITYVITAPIFGYLGDRLNRKWLLLGGTLTWSILILASSFIPEELFWLFVVLRAFSGLGDAAVNTIAPAIMADMFEGKARSYALMIFYYSLPFGWSVSTIIASQFIESNTWWQWGLRVVPPFGIATVILLAFLIQNPDRRVSVSDGHTSVWQDIKRIMTVPSFILLLFAIAAINIVTGAQGWWNPTMTQLAMNSTDSDPNIFHGESYALIQSIVGIENTAGGIVGTTISVWITELWSSGSLLCLSSTPRAAPLVGALGDLLALPSTMIVQRMYLIDINWNYVLGFYGSIMSFGTYALCMNVLLRVIPPTNRATATAIYNTFGSIFGDASSPYVVGAIADSVRDYSVPDQAGDHLNALLFAFYFSNAFMAVCSLCFFAIAYFIVRDEKRVKDEQTEILTDDEVDKDSKLTISL